MPVGGALSQPNVGYAASDQTVMVAETHNGSIASNSDGSGDGEADEYWIGGESNGANQQQTPDSDHKDPDIVVSAYLFYLEYH